MSCLLKKNVIRLKHLTMIGIIKSIKKWIGTAMEFDTSNKADGDLFRTIDIEKAADRLSLNERGRERGGHELPDAKDENLDEVERQVLSLVEKNIDFNHRTYEEQANTCRDRVGLAFTASDYTNIEIKARDAVAEFRKFVEEERSQLEIKERKLLEIESERSAFKKRNNLERTAHYPEPGSKILRYGVIAVLLLVESIFNTPLLAKGSELGITGGVTQAITIAILNIGIAAVTGYVGLRELFHRNLFRKLLGLIWLTVWFATTIAFNLLVAHYREVSAALITDPGVPQLVVNKFIAHPLGLNDFLSWVLFGLGVLAALIALLDTFFLDDAYPFYGKLDRKHQKLCQEYADSYSRFIHDLSAPRPDISKEIADAIKKLETDQYDRYHLISDWKTSFHEFKASVKKLNDQGNELLQIYRLANEEARSSPSPKHFQESIKTELDQPVSEPNAPSVIDTKVGFEQLQKVMNRFYDECDRLLEEIKPLRKVFKEPNKDDPKP